jgi:lysozyme
MYHNFGHEGIPMADAIERAIADIKRHEGFRAEAYPDPATGGAPWTVGFGATGRNIRPGTVWTREEAEEDLIRRVEVLDQQIDASVTVPLTTNQRVALICLTYNIGIGRVDDPDTPENEGSGLRGSTLLRKLNAEDYDGAADQFLRWNRANGRVMRGLTNRREAERELFLTPDE